ncbi:MAG: D-aminoacyl-tRNA deacylase [Candidatus Cloacimonadaceae bacterium]|jgi:D-tyrosyl-tRNA(Tyr) deacylase
MRVILQRVLKASVSVEGKVVGAIRDGLLLFVGFGREDEEEVLDTAVDKILNLRIFSDENGKLNRSLLDENYSILAISQFTLYANCTRGRRPDFTKAAQPDKASHLFELFKTKLKEKGVHTESGIFAADMLVELINDGPVTISLEF